MSEKYILELENVTKYYGKDLVFKDVNLKVKKGEVISLIGKSGCGKSTLLKCINKLEDIEEGTIKVVGRNIDNTSLVDLRQKVGIVFQDYNLFEHLTVLENLTIGLINIKKYSKSKSEQLAINMLKKIELVAKKDKYPDELSGGQKQRVAIARTLLMKPAIILLDEPTSALDVEIKDSVLNLINELVKEDMTLIIVSHEENFVNQVSDRIYKIVNYKLKEIK